MSLNSALSQSHVVDVEIVKSELEPFLQRRRLASTQEEIDSLEGQAISFLEQLIDYDFKLMELYKGAQLYRDDLDGFYGMYSAMLRSNLRRSEVLESQFVKYFNSQQIALHHLIGRLRRVRQKRASLALWSTTDFKYVLADNFLNLDFLDTTFTNRSALAVDTAQGVLTLPVAGVEAISIARIVIGTDSNGFAGNSDQLVSTNNNQPAFAINGDPNNWFEYERLDSGPLQLSLQLELRQETIVNQLTLQSVNFDNSQAFEVEDVLFVVGSETKSILDLAGPSVDADRYVVKSIGNDTAWHLNFIPIKTRSITLKLRQNSSYPIEVANTNRGVTRRWRWAIGLRSIGLNRVRYDASGGINSLIHKLPVGLYAGQPFLSLWPTSTELYDLSLETSQDGGSTWGRPENVDDGVGSTILFDGTAKDFVWRLGVDRNDAALANAVSFLPVDNTTPKIETLLRIISPNASPASFRLPSNPLDGNVWVIQPRIARRGERQNRVLIGKLRGTDRTLLMPFDILGSGLDLDQIHLYADGTELVQTPLTATAEGEYNFINNNLEIFLPKANAAGNIELVIDPELMQFTQFPDGYYHTMELPFDPDETNIKIKYLPRNQQQHQLILKKGKTIHRLPHRDIVSNSVRVYSSLGTAYTVIYDKSSGIGATEVYFDTQAGTVEFGASFGADTIVVSYGHLSAITLSSDDYSVVFDGARPIGVRVNPLAFEALQVTEVIGDSTSERYDPVTKTWAARTPSETVGPDTKVKTLSHERVVVNSFVPGTGFLVSGLTPERVNYIDGRTEFFGLVPMLTEQTNELTDGSGVVTFNLAAGSLWDSDIDPVFGDANIFDPALRQPTAGVVNAAGEWHVSAAGLVTVYVGHVGNTLPAGISIQYYYVDPDFDPTNKYSVDHANGMVYSFSDMDADASVTYKASRYTVEYDVCKPLNASYDRVNNSVKVGVENISDINRNVKLIWPVPVSSQKLREFAPFFSPLIEVFGVRFN